MVSPLLASRTYSLILFFKVFRPTVRIDAKYPPEATLSTEQSARLAPADMRDDREITMSERRHGLAERKVAVSEYQCAPTAGSMLRSG